MGVDKNEDIETLVNLVGSLKKENEDLKDMMRLFMVANNTMLPNEVRQEYSNRLMSLLGLNELVNDNQNSVSSVNTLSGNVLL